MGHLRPPDDGLDTGLTRHENAILYTFFGNSMKVIFLNAWDGKMTEAIRAFVLEHRADTDVFCFQESDEAMEIVTKEILSEYDEFSDSKKIGQWFLKNTIHVRKGIQARLLKVLFREDVEGKGVGLCAEVCCGEKKYCIVNIHGKAYPGGDDKRDTPQRLEQSKEILDFLGGVRLPKIVGGDFNLFPDTKSIGMFREAGFKDLIEEYTIPTTRNHLAWDRYPDTSKQLFADYVFVTPDIFVRFFSVPQNEVSDHLPLIVEMD